MALEARGGVFRGTESGMECRREWGRGRRLLAAFSASPRLSFPAAGEAHSPGGGGGARVGGKWAQGEGSRQEEALLLATPHERRGLLGPPLTGCPRGVGVLRSRFGDVTSAGHSGADPGVGFSFLAFPVGVWRLCDLFVQCFRGGESVYGFHRQRP